MPASTIKMKWTAPTTAFCIKAAAIALILAAAILASVFLVANFPENHSGWRDALPTPRTRPEDVSRELLRARYLHEAAVRPQLVAAGFGSRENLRADTSTSQALTNALWRMRFLPEIHDALLTVLLDANRPTQKRLEEFMLYGGLLSSVSDAFGGNDYQYFFNRDASLKNSQNWFRELAADPRASDVIVPQEASHTAPSQQDAIAAYETALSLSQDLLPFFFTILQKENQQTNAETDQESIKAHLQESSEDLWLTASLAWRNRNVPGFSALLKQIVASQEGTLQERCRAVSLMDKTPGLAASEYIFWSKRKEALNTIKRCVGTNPASYAYLIGCCDTFSEETREMLAAQGSILLGTHEGPGVTITRIETFQPERNLTGKLYLLADMRQALKKAPPYDLSRAHPIFKGMLFRHLENQPLVLPLDIDNPADRRIISWYGEEGWREGRTLLFSATGTPANIARHWGGVHLLWWPNDKKTPDAEPDLAYLHPTSGHFMLAMAPNLKGKEVSRFFGSITGLWFGRIAVDENGWIEEKYEARPEATPLPAARSTPLHSPLLEWLRKKTADKGTTYAEATLPSSAPSIVVSDALRQAATTTYGHYYRISQAQRLLARQQSDAMTPHAAFSFADGRLQELSAWGVTQNADVTHALDLFWQYRDNPEASTIIRNVLSDTKLSPCQRICKVRRVLGLPAKNRSRR